MLKVLYVGEYAKGWVDKGIKKSYKLGILFVSTHNCFTIPNWYRFKINQLLKVCLVLPCLSVGNLLIFYNLQICCNSWTALTTTNTSGDLERTYNFDTM